MSKPYNISRKALFKSLIEYHFAVIVQRCKVPDDCTIRDSNGKITEITHYHGVSQIKSINPRQSSNMSQRIWFKKGDENKKEIHIAGIPYFFPENSRSFC